MKIKSHIKLKRIWNAIKPFLPWGTLPIVIFIYRKYISISCWFIGFWDQRYVKKTGFSRLPPASLRYRVSGSLDIDLFLEVGERSYQDIETALRKIGKSLSSFQHILDFGCGCGRILIGFPKHSQTSHYYGTDIDADAISWCRENIHFANFDVNEPVPPLKYLSESFDFIYAISVFTHLNEDFQFHWLNELKRITKPNGFLILTINGYSVWKGLLHKDVSKIERRGFHFIIDNVMKDIFPEWYQNAYHTKEYVFHNYAKHFKVVDYIPGGLCDYQDIIILQK